MDYRWIFIILTCGLAAGISLRSTLMSLLSACEQNTWDVHGGLHTDANDPPSFVSVLLSDDDTVCCVFLFFWCVSLCRQTLIWPFWRKRDWQKRSWPWWTGRPGRQVGEFGPSWLVVLLTETQRESMRGGVIGPHLQKSKNFFVFPPCVFRKDLQLHSRTSWLNTEAAEKPFPLSR